MKLALLTLLILSTFMSTVLMAKKSDVDSQIKPRIVGGEVTNEGDWPWMSALVFVGNQINTSLDVNGDTFNTSAFSFAPSGQASATMADCGIGDSTCSTAKDKICVIARGEINFSVKVTNCQLGGGLGAIIYNNVVGNFDGTLGDDYVGNIPVVAISQADGNTLLGQLDNVASIDVSARINSSQSSTCGASFLGDKWVLTAAHCVEAINPNTLKVNVGEYDLSNGAENATSIKNIYIHPDYNLETDFNNDIALIELVESIDKPAVTLATAATTTNLASMTSYATVIGWGNQVGYGPDDEQPAGSQPDKLYQVELSLMTNEQCKNQLIKAYQDLNDFTYLPEELGITDTMICANYADGGRGSCQGDSGGPLLVNTNEGFQQVGIVSFGGGCADGRFPGVYARVGEFNDWIKSITGGIVITANYDFAISPQGITQSTILSLTNNSFLDTNLMFSLEFENVDYQGISLITDNCTLLPAKSSCDINVVFDAKTAGKHQAKIIIDTNNEYIPAATSVISAEALANSDEIGVQLSSNSPELAWFTGGNLAWQLDDTEAAIMSGDIMDGQESPVILTFSGAGLLSFEWAVSSEENIDNPAEPFDALFLIVNGQQFDFISGEVGYTSVELPEFSDGEHQITWVYSKDTSISEGEDKGYIKNVMFTETMVDPLQPIEPLEPLEPIEPLEPLEPIEPLEPLEPIEPLEPLEPIEPLEPLEPIEPLEPLEPIEPLEPLEPLTPISTPPDNNTSNQSSGGSASFMALLILVLLSLTRQKYHLTS
jgi:secreted trypsin-like serine protease